MKCAGRFRCGSNAAAEFPVGADGDKEDNGTKPDDKIMKKLIEYVCVWRNGPFQMTEEDIRCIDIINIAFALIKEKKVIWDYPEYKEAFARIRNINPSVKIVLSVGGWGAGGFSEAAYTEESRKNFASDCLELMEEYGFDGIDIDWEYPGFSLGGIRACPEDKENFTLLLKEVRKSFEEKERGRYLLSIAAGGGNYFVRNTNMREAAQYLDYVQLMTYDLRGGFQNVTGHHANLFLGSGDMYDASADLAVAAFVQAGVPAEKLVMGAAFFGRRWDGAANSNHGLGQMARTAGNCSCFFGELKEKYIDKNGFVRYWDNEAKAPWLFNGISFISYEDEESLSCKIEYMKKKDMAGIMVWEYCQDTTHTRTKYMRKEMDRG